LYGSPAYEPPKVYNDPYKYSDYNRQQEQYRYQQQQQQQLEINQQEQEQKRKQLETEQMMEYLRQLEIQKQEEEKRKQLEEYERTKCPHCNNTRMRKCEAYDCYNGKTSYQQKIEDVKKYPCVCKTGYIVMNEENKDDQTECLVQLKQKCLPCSTMIKLKEKTSNFTKHFIFHGTPNYQNMILNFHNTTDAVTTGSVLGKNLTIDYPGYGTRLSKLFDDSWCVILPDDINKKMKQDPNSTTRYSVRGEKIVEPIEIRCVKIDRNFMPVDIYKLYDEYNKNKDNKDKIVTYNLDCFCTYTTTYRKKCATCHGTKYVSHVTTRSETRYLCCYKCNGSGRSSWNKCDHCTT